MNSGKEFSVHHGLMSDGLRFDGEVKAFSSKCQAQSEEIVRLWRIAIHVALFSRVSGESG